MKNYRMLFCALEKNSDYRKNEYLKFPDVAPFQGSSFPRVNADTGELELLPKKEPKPKKEISNSLFTEENLKKHIPKVLSALALVGGLYYILSKNKQTSQTNRLRRNPQPQFYYTH